MILAMLLFVSPPLGAAMKYVILSENHTQVCDLTINFVNTGSKCVTPDVSATDCCVSMIFKTTTNKEKRGLKKNPATI